eukprot:scaffold119119_cov51-Phaeocystis_antarctica.AAC.2
MKCHRFSGRSVGPVSRCVIADLLAIGSPRDNLMHVACVAGQRKKSSHSMGKSEPRSIITLRVMTTSATAVCSLILVWPPS